MRHRSLLGILALVPVALNVSEAAAGSPMAAPLCNGAAAAGSFLLPQLPAPFRSGGQGCCIKGCHTGTSRRRSACHI